MDNEKEIFQQAFRELGGQLQDLPIAEPQLQRLQSILSIIQRIAENLALYDPLTHVLNVRAFEWLTQNEHIIGMAKIDIYDLRQANKMYGATVIDSALQKLGYDLTSIFSLETGDFVRRSPGSDEFRIFSTSKTPEQISELLTKLCLAQKADPLITWDFGVGYTETEVEYNLQEQRKSFRPIIIRQTVPESHSDIPRRFEKNNYISWNEFNRPYERLVDSISSFALPDRSESQVIDQVMRVKKVVESIIIKDGLTGAFNALGAAWYMDDTSVKGIVLTDMVDMHEGNTRYGSAAIDQDLKRFAKMLAEQFPTEDGFLLFRTERAGDEFKVISTKLDAAHLIARIHVVWQNDLHHGLLAWNYGVGMDDAAAYIDLYKNRREETEHVESCFSSGASAYIVAKPDGEDYASLVQYSKKTAQLVHGTPIIDLHFTLQAIRAIEDEDFADLKKRLAEYCLKLHPFEIKVKHIARININDEQGKLWLLIEKTPELEKIYSDLSQIAHEINCESYPYESEDWMPHIKIVVLPENALTQLRNPTFGASREITFKVKCFDLVVQIAQDRWQLIHQFRL